MSLRRTRKNMAQTTRKSKAMRGLRRVKRVKRVRRRKKRRRGRKGMKKVKKRKRRKNVRKVTKAQVTRSLKRNPMRSPMRNLRRRDQKTKTQRNKRKMKTKKAKKKRKRRTKRRKRTRKKKKKREKKTKTGVVTTETVMKRKKKSPKKKKPKNNLKRNLKTSLKKPKKNPRKRTSNMTTTIRVGPKIQEKRPQMHHLGAPKKRHKRRRRRERIQMLRNPTLTTDLILERAQTGLAARDQAPAATETKAMTTKEAKGAMTVMMVIVVTALIVTLRKKKRMVNTKNKARERVRVRVRKRKERREGRERRGENRNTKMTQMTKMTKMDRTTTRCLLTMRTARGLTAARRAEMAMLKLLLPAASSSPLHGHRGPVKLVPDQAVPFLYPPTRKAPHTPMTVERIGAANLATAGLLILEARTTLGPARSQETPPSAGALKTAGMARAARTMEAHVPVLGVTAPSLKGHPRLSPPLSLDRPGPPLTKKRMKGGSDHRSHHPKSAMLFRKVRRLVGGAAGPVPNVASPLLRTRAATARNNRCQRCLPTVPVVLAMTLEPEVDFSRQVLRNFQPPRGRQRPIGRLGNSHGRTGLLLACIGLYSILPRFLPGHTSARSRALQRCRYLAIHFSRIQNIDIVIPRSARASLGPFPAVSRIFSQFCESPCPRL